MAVITAEMVRSLREETDAPMMKCKQALTDADGNMEEARKLLRIAGLGMAAKRADRVANEGYVESFINEVGDVGVLVELNCETDFVARSDGFRSVAGMLARHIAEAPSDAFGDVDSLLASSGQGGKPISEQVNEAVAKLGERVVVSRFARMDVSPTSGAVSSYIHRTNFKTGAMVKVLAEATVTDVEALTELAREIALHIAAAKPGFTTREDVPAEAIAREREIATAKMQNDPKFAGKPEAARTAMLEGQVRKFLESTVLLDQPFVRDSSGKQRISDLVEQTSKKVGSKVRIAEFKLFIVGATAGEAPAE